MRVPSGSQFTLLVNVKPLLSDATHAIINTCLAVFTVCQVTVRLPVGCHQPVSKLAGVPTSAEGTTLT
jgi:hypothetical protein